MTRGLVRFLILGMGLAPHAILAKPVTSDDLVKAQENAGEWLTYGRDYRNWRYSPLTEITPDNAAKLTPVWAMSTGGQFGGLESTPLFRDGVRQNTMSQSSRPVDAFLLDRIEILKGPSSLLYGEGAIGGAVNVVSKAPAARTSPRVSSTARWKRPARRTTPPLGSTSRSTKRRSPRDS